MAPQHGCPDGHQAVRPAHSPVAVPSFTMAPVATRRLPPLVCAGVLLLLSGGAFWQVPFAHAADETVAVQAADGGRYSPAEVTIELGDTVTWVWEDLGHSVTHRPGPGQERLFDSHPPSQTLCPAVCGAEEDTFTFSEFPEPGTYEYFSHQNEGMLGVVVVEPASEPDPTTTSEPGTPKRPEPSSEPEPSTTETSDPEPSPTDAEDPEPSPTTDEPEPEPDPPPPPPDPGPRTVAPQPIERDAVDPAPTAGAPTVAEDDSPSPVPDPTFEEFPEADDPSDAADVEGEIAIGGSDDGGDTNRTLWALIGGASVLGTLGAFGRTLLVSDAWNA